MVSIGLDVPNEVSSTHSTRAACAHNLTFARSYHALYEACVDSVLTVLPMKFAR